MEKAITNVSTTYVHTVETDHKFMIAKVKFKLKAHNTTKTPIIPRFRTPSPQELASFNDQIRHLASAQDILSNSETTVMEQLNEIIKTSSEALPRKQPEQKRCYISQQSWPLLERK